MRRMRVLLVLVVLASGLVDAARRRVRSTTSATVTTTTPVSFIGRQIAFAEQPEELEVPWDNYDIQKLDARSGFWKYPTNTSGHREETIVGRQYPGLPINPGDTNELPSPISPQPTPSPPKLPPGCLGPRGQYPSPRSCSKFLNCWDGIVVEQDCPAGLLFNDVTNVCDFPYNVNCGDRPSTPKPPLPPTSKLCPDPNGRYRSSTNCSEFYVCVSGKPIKFCCPYGLVYNDLLNVCDYPYNVDCKGSATPKPPPPTHPTKPPTHPPKPPTKPPKPSPPPQTPPTYPPQQPGYPPPPPAYPPQQPTYPPQQPPYAPQVPTYPPQQPSYQPQPPSSYPGNPWLTKVETDPWHQRPIASQLEIENERMKQESAENQQFNTQPQLDVTEISTLINPWNLFQVVPPELMTAPCKNGDVHRLNEACTNMVVCRNNKPQMVRCSPGFSYDKPSNSCKPFSVAKC